MNKKLFLAISATLALIVVAIAAIPAFAQGASGSGDMLRTQDQLQTKYCSCNTNEPVQLQDQTQLKVQEAQQCTQTCIGNDTCDGTQTRQQECLQQQAIVGGNGNLDQNIYCNAYQQQQRYRNQAP